MNGAAPVIARAGVDGRRYSTSIALSLHCPRSRRSGNARTAGSVRWPRGPRPPRRARTRYGRSRTARRGRRRSAARPRPGRRPHSQRLDETVLPLPPVGRCHRPFERSEGDRDRGNRAKLGPSHGVGRPAPLEQEAEVIAIPASRAATTGEPVVAAPPCPAEEGQLRPSRTQSVATTRARRRRRPREALAWPASSPTSSTKTSPPVTSRTAWPVRESQSSTSRSGWRRRRGATARSRAADPHPMVHSRVTSRRVPGGVAGERRRQPLGEVVVDGHDDVSGTRRSSLRPLVVGRDRVVEPEDVGRFQYALRHKASRAEGSRTRGSTTRRSRSATAPLRWRSRTRSASPRHRAETRVQCPGRGPRRPDHGAGRSAAPHGSR